MSITPATQKKRSRRSNRSSGSIFPRRRRPAAFTRRVVLVVLLCASLGLITATYRGGVAIHGAQMVVLDVVAPIQRGMNRAWDPIAGAANWTSNLFSAASENPRLERENAELRRALHTAEANEAAYAERQRLLAMIERNTYPDAYEEVVGTVRSRGRGAINDNIVIDLGREHGIVENDPVLVADGLIGYVLRVSKNSAVVSLIINDSESVTAMVVGSSAEGSLKPVSTEGSPVMQMLVDPNAVVREGDPVVTNGFVLPDLRSRYPRDISIGYVSSVGFSPSAVYKTVQVTPYASFTSIRKVMVLVPRGEREVLVAPPAVTPSTAEVTSERRVDKAVVAPVKTAKAKARDAAEQQAAAKREDSDAG